jgi:deoxyribodipyrimidine photo-lyase
MKNDVAISVFWFRRDLRLEDNVGLSKALEAGRPVLPLFVFDTEILSELELKQDARLEFIHQEVMLLHEQLKAKGSGMLVKVGKPIEVWAQLLREFQITAVFTNEDYEPYARQRDGEVKDLLASKNASFQAFKDQVIMAPGEVLKDDGKPYTIYTPFANRWRKQFTEVALAEAQSAKLLSRCLQDSFPSPPSLTDLGFAPAGIPFPPRWPSEATLQQYHQQRDLPAVDLGTSRMGLHLRFGTVSVRKLVAYALKLNQTYLGELIWREFFMQILHHFPQVVQQSFKPQYDRIQWLNNPDEFERWCQGRTGFPLVDAGMRELNATGHMHNRVRMVVASFLCKDLLIDWRWGEAYFASRLLDYELASNNGNWQWAAGTGCDAAPYFRIFNPDAQMKKFDPQGKYVMRWVPEFGTPAYPKPMVDHSMARDRCLAAYKEAVKEG